MSQLKQPPSTAVEFKKNLKTIKDDSAVVFDYLKDVVTLKHFQVIFSEEVNKSKTSLEVEELMPIIRALIYGIG